MKKTPHCLPFRLIWTRLGPLAEEYPLLLAVPAILAIFAARFVPTTVAHKILFSELNPETWEYAVGLGGWHLPCKTAGASEKSEAK